MQYLTIRQLAHQRPIFSEASIRDKIFKSEDRKNSRGEIIQGNGLAASGALIRLGRKILIDLNKWDAWIDGHRVTSEQENGK